MNGPQKAVFRKECICMYIGMYVFKNPANLGLENCEIVLLQTDRHTHPSGVVSNHYCACTGF